MKRLIYYLMIIFIIVPAGCSNNKKEENGGDTIIMAKKISQYAETEIKYDENLLDEKQKKVVEKLYEASQIIDEIFLEQVYSKNFKIRDSLRDSEKKIDKLDLEYFNINFGPFDRLADNAPFVGSALKPEGANFYPEDMTKEEFENRIKNHPEDEASFRSEFTVIRREDNKLTAIPYSEYYKEKLSKAANLLREAAEYAENETLKDYLLKRADAFESNDYYESDMAWMDLKDHSIEVIIGPYEVYEDELFNYKASFESFVTIVDTAETHKLEKFASYLKDMEDNLPLPEELKNYERGSESPIVVVQEVFSAGDTKAGVQTLAFNLPNDERVRKAKGSKKVLLKNIHEAKFDKLLYPIAQIVMDQEQLKYVTFEGFFNHTLMHEMSHGIGPGYITKDGKKTEVKIELKETYSKIEECKADILGMWNNLLMIEKGVYPEDYEKQIWATFLAGIFRSVRFGVDGAHGAGNAIIYNFMLENGAYEFDSQSQKVKVNYEKAKDVLEKLANKILMIQAKGDYEGANQIIAQYGNETHSIIFLKEKLKDLPVDIRPTFQIEKDQVSRN